MLLAHTNEIKGIFFTHASITRIIHKTIYMVEKESAREIQQYFLCNSGDLVNRLEADQFRRKISIFMQKIVCHFLWISIEECLRACGFHITMHRCVISAAYLTPNITHSFVFLFQFSFATLVINFTIMSTITVCSFKQKSIETINCFCTERTLWSMMKV